MKNLISLLQVSRSYWSQTTDIFKEFITLDETGYIVNTPGSSKTM
jgi:hypothetical protein